MSDDKDTRLLPEDDPEIQEALERYKPRAIGTGKISGKTELMLLIEDDIKRFPLTKQTPWLLGRFDATDHPNQIDLNPYAAHTKGVSRLHAQLHIQDEQLFITDLNSSNGTYLNDVRLKPNKATFIPNGALLLLGVFPIQVMFR
jgi:FHA domain